MEMTQIRYFIAVSETLNFTRAAERCFISQPALTKGIKKLEASIGGELLHRTKTQVKLTYLGESLLPKFKQIFQDANLAKEEAQRLLKQDDRRLKIGVQSHVNMDQLLSIFQSYKFKNAPVEFEFLEGTAKALKAKLSTRELDVLFIDEDCGSNTIPVFLEPFVIAFAKGHEFSKKNALVLRDLENQRLCNRSQCDVTQELLRTLQFNGIRVECAYRGNKDEQVVSLVSNQLGVACLPQSQAEKEGLAYLTLKDCVLQQGIYLVLPANQALSVKVRTFVSTVFSNKNVDQKHSDVQLISKPRNSLLLQA